MSLDVTPFLTGLTRENNQLTLYTPRITVQSVPSLAKWTPVYVRQFTTNEAKQLGIEGQGNCFIVLLDHNGEPIYRHMAFDAYTYLVRHGWEGMRPDEAPQPARFEKPFPEPPCNIPLFGQAKYWFEIVDASGIASDRVLGVTLANPDDTDPNAHHSTLIIWQLQSQAQQQEPGTVVVPLSLLLDIETRYRQLGELIERLR